MGVDNAGYLVSTPWALRLQNGTSIYYNGGNVGLGTFTPSEKLQVVGNVKANAFLTTSDRRLKSHITPLSSMIDRVLALKPVSFTWNDTQKDDIGFIAQDVEQLFPQLIATDMQGFKSMKYGQLISPLIQ